MVDGERTQGREEDDGKERGSERESKAREDRMEEVEGVEGEDGAAKGETEDEV